MLAAVVRGGIDEIRIRILEGGDITRAEGVWGTTPLMAACAPTQKLEVLEFLLACPMAESAINTKNLKGMTALHQAAWYGQEEAVRMLLRGGADRMMRTSEGLTIEEVAKVMGHHSVHEFLTAKELPKVETADELRERLKAQYRQNSQKRLQQLQDTKLLLPPPKSLDLILLDDSPPASGDKLTHTHSIAVAAARLPQLKPEDGGAPDIDSKGKVFAAATAAREKGERLEAAKKRVEVLEREEEEKQKDVDAHATRMRCETEHEEERRQRQQDVRWRNAETVVSKKSISERVATPRLAWERRVGIETAEVRDGARLSACEVHDEVVGDGVSFFITQELSIGKRVEELDARPVEVTGRTRPDSAVASLQGHKAVIFKATVS